MSIGREHVDRISETLKNLEGDFEENSEEIVQRARGTELVIRILAAIMGLLALSNLYFANDLTEEVKAMIGSMQKMIGHFDSVAQRMDSVTVTVHGMNETIGMMPVVASQIDEIADHVEVMNSDVARMQETTVAVDRRIHLLNRDITDMAGRYRSVNYSIGRMGRDVDQMARPVP